MLLPVGMYAQQHMHIHYKDGTQQTVPLERVDSVTFAPAAEEDTADAVLTGGWLWASMEAGYYELLSFAADHTYTAYDNYFGYGLETRTYGLYAQYGNLLTLRSHGYGYSHRYDWLVTALTANALAVTTRMGSFTYYRLQPETISLQLSGSARPCEPGGDYLFADGIVATVTADGLRGLKPGTTYVLCRQAGSGHVVAYQVTVLSEMPVSSPNGVQCHAAGS